MRRANRSAVLAVNLAVFASTMAAADLKSSTLDAWQHYIDAARVRMQARLEPGAQFLWADQDPERAARIKEGGIEVEPLIGRGWKSVPGGLIHDWIGATFIPNASLNDLFGVLEDYDHYKDVYKPVVIDSQLEQRANGTDRFSMRWLHKVLFVTAAIDTQNESHTYRVGDCRAYTLSQTTDVREIENYGQPDQRELAPDKGNGFIWRLYSINRYEERDGGLYVEVEAMALTRDIPFSLRFLVKPVVMKLSRDSLDTSLEQTRNAVHETELAREVGGNSPQAEVALLVRAMKRH
jgi:hypothetical protein